MRKLLSSAALLCALAAPLAQADQDVTLIIENHVFSPSELRVAANQKIRIVIDNRDASPEEFESKKLRAEKVIPGKSKGLVVVGPLKPGSYPFFGEFNEKTAQGVLIAE
ncbi:cupredoxin domain-containing protein [Uliginosibacterium sediminicola]|uniref:Cupredoxin domain-containing protein n=1 Tax=Uliginosibacterium sediminicola TaxID=2024550 RepID=A0ABU9Z3P3_9RHOO